MPDDSSQRCQGFCVFATAGGQPGPNDYCPAVVIRSCLQILSIDSKVGDVLVTLRQQQAVWSQLLTDRQSPSVVPFGLWPLSSLSGYFSQILDACRNRKAVRCQLLFNG